jgi:hypothetical protein
MKNTESKATQCVGASSHQPLDNALMCAGTSNPPLCTSHSRARGPPNPPHGSTLRTRLMDYCQGVRRGAPPPESVSSCQTTIVARSRHIIPRRTSRHRRARRPKMSPAPSSVIAPPREDSTVLKTPLRSAVGQVLTGCHCCKCRPSTLSCATLNIAEKLQASQNAASSRTTTEGRPLASNRRASDLM